MKDGSNERREHGTKEGGRREGGKDGTKEGKEGN